MFKVREKHSPIFLALFILFNVGLIIAVIWLASITNNSLFWVIAIIIDLLIGYLSYSTFRSMLKPKEVLRPLPKPLVYRKEEVMSSEQNRKIEENEKTEQ